MSNKRDITIKVIHDKIISNLKSAEYFAKKYEKEMRKTQSQKS